jgi:type I restriction enzyme, S subunit
MSFPRYPKYRNGGVDWIGRVPAHWSRTRIKHAALPGAKTFIDGDWIEAPYITDGGVRLIQCGNVGTGIFEEQGFRYVSEATFRELDCTEVKSDDVLICRLQSSRTILAGRACLAPQLGVKMITSVDNCILKPSSDFDPRYIVYQLTTQAYLSFIEVVARGGTRDRVSRSMLGDIELIAPPVNEQSLIAEFLDRETAKIDALINEQRRLIELLTEKRQAVISHAITKGLNPLAPTKPSGIEWLGDLPEHWQITKLAYLLRETPKNGISPEITADGTTPTFSIAAVRNGTVDIDNHIKYASLDLDDALPYLVKRADILVLRGSGSKDLVGTVGIVVDDPPENCIYPDILIRIRPNRLVLPRYLVECLNSIALRPQIRMAAQTAAGIWKISGGSLQAIRMPCPPIKEQQEIEDYLRIELSTLDTLTAESERGIDLLQERRTALISAAVTGKIDVRGLAESEAA